MVMKKYGNLIFGIVMLITGIIYLLLTTQIQRKGELIDGTFFPYILSCAMLLLGILQIYYGTKDAKKFAAEAAGKTAREDDRKADNISVFKTIITIGIYLALLQPLGFIISSALFLFALFTILTPVGEKKNFLLYAIIAICAAVSIYMIFRYTLNLVLPQGLIKGI
jgi:putative tricarboxylic transport membrane protein